MISKKALCFLFVSTLHSCGIREGLAQVLNIPGKSAQSNTINTSVSLPTLVGPPNISYQTPQTYTANALITPLSPTNTGGTVPPNIYGQVSTFVGTGAAGSTDGNGTGASISAPFGLTTDGTGNIYLADYNNNLIRKITPAGVVTTLAGIAQVHGSADGRALSATFALPAGVAADNVGNIYVADSYNNLVRKITPDGIVSTLAGSPGVSGSADGIGANASFNSPVGIAVDNSGIVYVADQNNNMIREITPGGIVTTLAGSVTHGSADGQGAAAGFYNPGGLTVDASGNIHVADVLNNMIRKITPPGLVTTVAGNTNAGSNDGQGVSATFNNPNGITIDNAGTLYVADKKNNKIRKITTDGTVSTLAGDGTGGSADGITKNATFSYPGSILSDGAGNIYVGDFSTFVIRKIGVTGYTIDKPLPPGLIFDVKTGIISGTPTAISPATDYVITAYNAGGSSSATVNIKVDDVQTVILPKISQKSVCNADFDPGATGSGPINYSSSNSAVAAVVSGKIHITGPGISIITATDGTSTASDTLTVIGALTPSIVISPDTIDNCQGTPVTYMANVINGGSNPAYQWQVNGKNSGTDNAVFASSNLSNNDKITCILTSNAACVTGVTVKSNTATFIIDPPITASITIISTAEGAICAGTPVSFIAETVTADASPIYQWQINNKNTGNNSPLFSSSKLTDGDQITCIMISHGKCLIDTMATSNSIVIKLSLASVCTIVIPNAITPNGDGINDQWNIAALLNYPKCTVRIYNRYGVLVYNSTGYSKAWDGTYNSAPLPAGIYYYVIDPKSDQKVFSGSVVIIR
ncbi:MAG: hypothetical protein JWP44_1585 [Mucilaginibacter sp.]|nr:hypothetical protein [Mucilaginibacter sp.]